MAIINFKTGALTQPQEGEPAIPAQAPVAPRQAQVPQNTGSFRQFQPSPAEGGLGAFVSGTRQGLINIGGGVLKTFGEIADQLGVEGAKKFLSDLEASQGIEQLRTQQETAQSPIAGTTGEIVGETIGFPFGGVGSSVAKRIGTSVVAGAAAGGLSEAGRGGSALDITGASLIGGAFGPLGEAIGEGLSKFGAKGVDTVKRLLAARSGREIPSEFFDSAGVPTREALSEIQRLGITPDEFKAAFSETAQGIVDPVTEGLPAEQAFRQARASQQGVRLTSGQTSRDFAEQEAEDTLKGLATEEGAQARQFFTAQQKELLDAKNNFLRSLGDEIDVSRTQRGGDVRTSIRDLNQASKENVRQLYTELSELPGGLEPISTAALSDFADRQIREITPSDRMIKGVKNIFNDFGDVAQKAPETTIQSRLTLRSAPQGTVQSKLTFKNAEKMRKRFNKLSPSDPADIAFIASLKDAFDNVVAAESQRFPDGTAIGVAAKKARSAAAKNFDTFKAKDIIEDLIGFKNGTRTERVPDSVIFDKLFSGGSRPGGQKVENIRRVKKVLLNKPTNASRQAWQSIQTQGALDIFNKAVSETPDGFIISGAKLNSALSNFGDDALKSLFGVEQLKSLRNFQKVVGDVTIPVPRTTNPSGTALKIMNALGRFANLSSGGFADKAIALTGAAAGSIKAAAQRKEVLDGILRGAKPDKKGIALLRMAVSPLAQRAAQAQTRDDINQEQVAP